MPGTATEKAALGYLHVNCGHCHNPSSGVHTIVNLELRLEVAKLGSTAATPAYTTAVDVAAQIFSLPVAHHCPADSSPGAGDGKPCLIDAQDPDASVLIYRFEATTGDSVHMPQLGSEMTDPDGDTALRAWISGL